MEVNYKPDHVVDDASAKKETGQDLAAWFKDLDAIGGIAAGRRDLGQYLFKERKVDAWWSTTLLVEYEAARGAKEKDGNPLGYNICVTKSIVAPVEMVFAEFGKGDWLGKGATCEFKEGGKFADKRGHKGVFKKIAAPRTIRFTFEGEGHSPCELVELKLTPTGPKIGLALMHNRCPSRAIADGMRAAWTVVLNAMKKKLEE